MENKPTSLLVVSLGKALNGTPSPLCGRQVAYPYFIGLQYVKLLTVTNKEICFIRVVFILCKALRYFFARLLTERKTLFFSQADCCVRHLLHQNCYDDIVKFQIGLVILPSSKNFDKRLA